MARLKIWVAGPRGWESRRPVFVVLSKLEKARGKHNLLVMNGGAPGIDKLSTDVCRELGIPVFENMAQWDVFGSAAGPKRNELILKEFKPHVLLAFRYFKLAEHLGTFNAVAQARSAGVRVREIEVSPGVALPSSISVEAPGSQARRDAKKRRRTPKRA